jgi:hypothetical protein
VQQAHRIGLEARHDVLLHFRPALAQRVHRRHQPVEAGMAFDRDAQLAGAAAGQARQVALGRADQRQHLHRQRRAGAGRPP